MSQEISGAADQSKVTDKTEKGITTTVVKWDASSFSTFLAQYGIEAAWEPELPAAGKTALEASPGKIALYEAFFTRCCFRLPITKFLVSAFMRYGVHPTQMTPFG